MRTAATVAAMPAAATSVQEALEHKDNRSFIGWVDKAEFGLVGVVLDKALLSAARLEVVANSDNLATIVTNVAVAIKAGRVGPNHDVELTLWSSKSKTSLFVGVQGPEDRSIASTDITALNQRNVSSCFRSAHSANAATGHHEKHRDHGRKPDRATPGLARLDDRMR